ncbi:putative pentatricopeptide [Medicago truncatula]|uniref:Putative pentatricopeptide n=1 Tax=Medicago truncatula TaxID=3880 RepID=A0A396GXC2_MEDTR|nr:putative pentatricopeptide [Medicago truncatula]
MRAFALKKLQVLSHYFCSNLHNIRKTSFSWNPILLSRKLHEATPVEKLHDDASMRQEELTIERKRSWISREDTIDHDEQKRFQFLLENLGLTTLVRMIHLHGPSIGFTGFNRLVKLLIEKARSTGDKCILLEQLNLIRHLLQSMPVVFRFQLEEETYGPLLKYIIDMGAVDEFKMFSKLIKDHNHNSISRLGYYDMLMWIRVNDEEMIRDACEYITIEDRKRTSKLRENYFLALCESDRKEQISDVSKNTNITEFASKSISNILKSLGRLQLKSEAEKLLLDYSEDHDDWEDYNDISNFIASYAVSIPNLEVEHLIKEIENLHDLMNISPSSSTYEKLILYCCGKNKVDAAIYVVDKMCEAFCMPSSHVMQSVLETCSETNLDFQVLYILRKAASLFFFSFKYILIHFFAQYVALHE